MVEPQVHTVFRQILEIETSTPDRVKQAALAGGWSTVAGAELPALLERAFDAAVPADRLLRIEQMQIELEAIPGESPEATLARELPGQLALALAAFPNQGQQQASITRRAGDWVLFYLENGYLPWSAPMQLTSAELEYRLKESLDTSPSLVRQLRELLLRDPTALHRLLFQFSPALSWRILLELYPAAERNWPEGDRQRLLENAAPPLRLARWLRLLEMPESSPGTIGGVKEDLVKKEAVQDTPANATDAAIFVVNAGLVLLHPFLVRLFQTVGYAEGARLVDPVSAVHLLHYLAAGATAEAEWQLVLPKLICGIPLKQAVDLSPGPLEGAKAAADEMLQAAIDHWSALKNTSIDGLRKSFLQREGRLVHNEDHWSLRVEQRPFDLLLDHLPWGIGMYRLPWMAQRMVVEWV